jgi:ubiquinone/menaquinone biosynthesis C-methylase UbiE
MSYVNSNQNAWDRDYSSRGRLWGGGVRGLPHLPEGASVLELGCGDGKTLAAMPVGWKTVALDISPQALRLSRRMLPDAKLMQADARLLPFRENSFDAIFAFHVTGHQLLQERRALAREVERVLVRGGSLFFREFGTEDMRNGQGDEVEESTFRRGSGVLTHYFSEGEAKDLFCDLIPISVGLHCWKQRIMGESRTRAEVEAVFRKS